MQREEIKTSQIETMQIHDDDSRNSNFHVPHSSVIYREEENHTHEHTIRFHLKKSKFNDKIREEYVGIVIKSGMIRNRSKHCMVSRIYRCIIFIYVFIEHVESEWKLKKKNTHEEKNFISSQLTRAELFSMILSKVCARIAEYVYTEKQNRLFQVRNDRSRMRSLHLSVRGMMLLRQFCAHENSIPICFPTPIEKTEWHRFNLHFSGLDLLRQRENGFTRMHNTIIVYSFTYI